MEAHYILHTLDFSVLSTLKAYDALLITKPQETPFSETEQYLLGQYIMQGSKVHFFWIGLYIDMENLRKRAAFIFLLDVGLDDQLFGYSLRINPDLVRDLYFGVYLVVVGNLGNQLHLELLP